MLLIKFSQNVKKNYAPTLFQYISKNGQDQELTSKAAFIFNCHGYQLITLVSN